ncbi:uncharacterized protein B0H18DRAFT_999097 [Fomitopsis serialis]|uniref:uncharacterized protein n=1 Tax=Fomitopsis serialis TaxID=139415 RepID=UPI0020080DFD|nr:uncharacterized protein B0H18DRAFT_999097 [Neoantrodia serialis]KAH9928864.1 hypothetical protein B0H18DRAFT_999097 [Neoantrodia serialis]
MQGSGHTRLVRPRAVTDTLRVVLCPADLCLSVAIPLSSTALSPCHALRLRRTDLLIERDPR